MSLLITLLVVLLIVSLLCWLIQTAPIPGPLAPTIRWVMLAIVVIFAIVYIARVGGVALP